MHKKSCSIPILSLLRELGGDKMRGLPRIVSLVRNEYNKFHHTGARILESINRLALQLPLKRLDFAIYTRGYDGRHYIALPKSVYH